MTENRRNTFSHSSGSQKSRSGVSRVVLSSKFLRKNLSWDFPGGPGVKTLPSNAGDASSISGEGDKITTSQNNYRL